jgi:hypothetical protein
MLLFVGDVGDVGDLIIIGTSYRKPPNSTSTFVAEFLTALWQELRTI